MLDAVVALIALSCYSSIFVRDTPAVPGLKGIWTSDTSVLPNNLLPHVPISGNGDLGIALSSVPWAPFQGPGIPSRGPGAQCRKPDCSGPHHPGVNLWLGSNSMWGVYPATRPSLGPVARATRVHLGGSSIVLGNAFATAVSPAFHAEQHIANGLLATSHISPHANFTTTTRIHPQRNLLVTTCDWVPLSSSTDKPFNITVSTWTYERMQGYNPHHGGLNPGQMWPLIAPTASGISKSGTGQAVQWVARTTTPYNASSPHPVRAALATTVTWAEGGSVKVLETDSYTPTENNLVAEALTTLELWTGRTARFTVTTALALEFPDVLNTSVATLVQEAIEDVTAPAAQVVVVGGGGAWW